MMISMRLLISLIIGLAIAFERIITLNRADINTRKFIITVKGALEEGGISAAEEVCANTRGPVASVFQAGLLRHDEGIDAVEKAIVSYGSIEMSFLVVALYLDGPDVWIPRNGCWDGRGI